MVDRPAAYKHYPDDCVFNKLVRNKVPEIVEKAGLDTVSRVIISDAEFKRCLIDKLHEEAAEVIEAFVEYDTGLAEELADLLTVMMDIARFEQVPWTAITELEKSKTEYRGDFSGRVFLERTMSRGEGVAVLGNEE